MQTNRMQVQCHQHSVLPSGRPALMSLSQRRQCRSLTSRSTAARPLRTGHCAVVRADATATVETVKPSQDLQALSAKPTAQQRTCIVTGANSGLGLATVRALAKTGALAFLQWQQYVQ